MIAISHNTQLFLFDYFSAELIGRPADRTGLFFKLGGMFLVPRAELDALFPVTQAPQIAAIDSPAASGLYFRTKSYLSTTGGAPPDADIDAVAAIKVGAIAALDKLKCRISPNKTRENILTALRAAAELGSIHALRVLGLLQVEGMIPARDGDGLDRLRRAGRWNDVPALFMLVGYEGKTHLDALVFAASTLACDLLPIVEQNYGVSSGGEPDECRLVLESLFGSGALDRALYSPVHADAVYSPVLDAQSKQDLVRSSGSAFESLVGGLPLFLAHGLTVNYDAAPLDGMPFKRDSELDAVRRWLYNTDLRGENYRPLGLCSDSQYMLDRYAAALRACLPDANVVKIDVGNTEEGYFLPTKNNIFLRNCRDDKPNVFFLYVCGETGARIERVKSFLRADGRARFMLDAPAVTLDLGDVLPVCFCDNANASRLDPLCDCVYITEPTREEKLAAIDDVIAERRVAYGFKSVSLAKGAADKLCAMSVDSLARAIDDTMRGKRKAGGKITLSASDFESAPPSVIIKFGFGG